MKSNELKALLAVLVVVVPLVFATGCGKKPDNVVVEPTVQAEITEAVETQAEITETIETQAETIGESVPDTTVEGVETLDESELYTEDKNEDIIAEETEPAEQTDLDVTEDPELTANDGVNYDKETGVITVIVNGEIADRVTKEEVESWGMTVDQYLSLFNSPSGGSSHSQEGLSDGECVPTVGDDVDLTGADRGHIQ